MQDIQIKRIWFFLLLITNCFYACENVSQSTLPSARGASGEIILVMDSIGWESSLGDELRSTFMKAIPGLPQSEPYFDLRYVSPSKLNSVLKSAKLMIFVTTLDNQAAEGKMMQTFFSESSIKRIQQEPNLHMYLKEDEYAQGQEVLYLFGKTEEGLIDYVQKNRERIRQHYLEITLKNITQNIYKSKEQHSLSQQLLKNYGFSIRVPYGYELVPLGDTVENFVWLRQLGDIDKSIVITFKDYTSEQAFNPTNILAFRENQLGKYIADDPEIRMTLQDEVPVLFDSLSFENRFAVEARGLWRMSTISMGGGFLSYTFVDERLNRLYYIEGFVYRPGGKKRFHMREIEAILHTFRLSGEEAAHGKNS
uniref:DUF4837 family protein n=1 Tax=Roseihalotalea indica TaxID=2867963 RepID=A0AA49JJ77_9BACT|nr:DUF4837 family protein [Tunicatimonas sp. TK19036]